MKIFVTGASGRFAREAVDLLLKEGFPASDLILMSRSPDKLEHMRKLGADIRYGDYEKPETLEPAVHGADCMLMISGHKVGHREAQHSAMIDAAKRAGIQQIVYTSYIGAEKENPAIVTMDHYLTEQKLIRSGIPFTALRDGMYADTMTNATIPQALRTGKWYACAGDGKIAMVDRADCVACAVKILMSDDNRHHNKIYNITDGETWSFPDMIKLVTELTGKKIEYINLNEDDYYAFLDSLGIPREPLEFNIDGFAWCSADMVTFERAVRLGYADIPSNDIQNILGRTPKTFGEFVRERAAELRKTAQSSNA